MECALSGCTRPSRKRGLCDTCYCRLKRRGDPLPPIRDRFWSHVQKSDDPRDCWMWTGPTWRGYGKSGNWSAHRRTYTEMVGPIPTGFQVDHLCHNADLSCRGGDTCSHRRCVNPGHLEAVTRQENMRRTAGRKAACPKGHVYDEANTGHGRSRSYVYCRQCNRDNQRNRRRMVCDGVSS